MDSDEYWDVRRPNDPLGDYFEKCPREATPAVDSDEIDVVVRGVFQYLLMCDADSDSFDDVDAGFLTDSCDGVAGVLRTFAEWSTQLRGIDICRCSQPEFADFDDREGVERRIVLSVEVDSVVNGAGSRLAAAGGDQDGRVHDECWWIAEEMAVSHDYHQSRWQSMTAVRATVPADFGISLCDSEIFVADFQFILVFAGRQQYVVIVVVENTMSHRH
nr:hypothetical protein [Halogranum gelatinilyticum]